MNMRYFYLSLIGIIMLFPVFAVTASEADTVIGECQERTGMGRESCISFIKKYMNVERCQQYAKLSVEECQKKLEEIRKSPEFRDANAPASVVETPKEASPHALSPSPISQGGVASLKEKIQTVRQDKAARFLLIEEELTRLVRFLQAQGQDVTQLEHRLMVLSEKRDVVLKAYDQYAALADGPTENRPSLGEPRRIVAKLLYEAMEYYRSDILPAFSLAIEAVQE